MSKSVLFIVLSVLIGLVMLIGLYTVVQAGKGSTWMIAGDRGAHLVSGVMVNLNHDRLSSTERQIYQVQLEMYSDYSGKGQGCESEWQTSPDD